MRKLWPGVLVVGGTALVLMLAWIYLIQPSQEKARIWDGYCGRLGGTPFHIKCDRALCISPDGRVLAIRG